MFVIVVSTVVIVLCHKYFMFRIDRSEKSSNLISIFTGEICNLACTLCAPDASTRWQYEANQYKIENDQNIDNTDSVDFTGATSITFGGGEPVLNKSTMPLLRKIDSNTEVMIHFNGTILPSQELLDECSRFNRITFTFSLDDTEERFEYLRWPGKWDKVIANMFWMKENCPDNIEFAVNTVISVLNESTYTTVEAWIKSNIPTNKAGKKTWCSTNESNGLLNRFNRQKEYKSMSEIEFLDKLDLRRKTNWRKTFPTAIKILEPIL